MEKFGIYDSDLGSVICDPIGDRLRILDIVSRQGVLSSSVEFEGCQRLGHLLVLPGIDERPSPPSELGYVGRITRWEYVSDREALVRTIKWSKADFAEFERQLYEHLELYQDKALKKLKAGYTDLATETWSQQQFEASEWLRDPSVSVPLLESLSAARGVTIDEIVKRIKEKVNESARLTGIILGAVQAAGDKIEALKAMDKLPADWFDQMQEIAAMWRKGWPDGLLEA